MDGELVDNHALARWRRFIAVVLSIPGRVMAALQWPARAVFGRDCFISYSRHDAPVYAAALAQALRPKFSCYLDQHDVPRGQKLPRRIHRELARASSLILIATPSVSQSIAIREEIELFLLTRRSIFILEPGDGLATAPWSERPWRDLHGVYRQPEAVGAIENGVPSEDCVDYLKQSFSFVTQDQRLRWVTRTAAVFLVAAIGISAYEGWQATRAAAEARKAGVRERAATERASGADRQVEDAGKRLRETMALESKARADADLQARIAQSRRLAVDATSESAGRPDLALLLAASAIRVEPTVEAYRSLLVALLRRPALRGVARDVHVISASTLRTLADKLFPGLSREDNPAGLQQPEALAPTQVVLSRDGRRFVTLALDGSAFLWDVAARRPVLKLSSTNGETMRAMLDNDEWTTQAAISVDGETVAVTDSTSVALWDVRRSRKAGAIKAPLVQALAMAGNTLVAIVSSDGDLELWDISRPASPRRTGQLTLGQRITAVGSDPEARLLTVFPKDRHSFLYCQLPSCAEFKTIKPHGGGGFEVDAVRGFSLTTQGELTRAATVESNGETSIWNLSNGQWLGNVKPFAPKGGGEFLSFASDSRSIFATTAGRVAEVRVPGETAASRPGLPLSFAADAPTSEHTLYSALGVVITVHEDGSVAFWDARQKNIIEREVTIPPVDNKKGYLRTAVSVDGLRGAVSGDSELVVFDLTAADALHQISIPLGQSEITELALSPDGQLIAGIVWPAQNAPNQELRVWDRAGVLRAASVIPKEVRQDATLHGAIGFGGPRDTPVVAATGVTGGTTVWTYAAPGVLRQISHEVPPATKFAFSPSGRTVAALGWASGPVIRVRRDGRLLGIFARDGTIEALTLPDDDTLLAYAGDERKLIRWNLGTTVTHPIETAIDDPMPGWQAKVDSETGSRSSHAAIARDGSRLAYEVNGSLYVWDATTPAFLFSTTVPKGREFGFDESSDRIVSVDSREVTAIELNTDALIQIACRIAGRPLTAGELSRYLEKRSDSAGCGAGESPTSASKR
jgi:WD40 repeat protein